MTTTTDEIRLRPLSIGEIFDRAITLYVRNFVSFVIAACVVAIPYAFFQYFASATNASSFQQILAQANGKTAPSPFTAMNPLALVAAFLMLLMQPFMYVAIAALVGRIYRSEQRDVRAAYALAFRHVGGVFMIILCAIAIYFAGILALMLPIVAIVALAMVAGWFSLVLIVPVALVFIAVVMLFYMALALAFNAIGIEEAPFGRAFSEGFSRVFARVEWKKAVLLGLALFAVQIGVMFVTMGVEGLTELVLHAPLLDAALMAALTLVANGFTGVLLAVYYFDLRVRREGLDMVAALESMPAATT